MSHKKYLLGSVALCGVLALAAPVRAQSASALNSQIQALQDQVRRLTQQLQTIQSQVQQTQQTQAQTQHTVEQMKTAPAASSGEALVTMKNGRPTISSADGQNTLGITGRLHFDAAAYDFQPNSRGTTPQNLNSGVNARRARIGVTGKFMGDWDYNLIFDFGGSSDNGSTIEAGYITFNGFAPFHFDFGYQDVPYTLDEATSSNNIMFIERSSAQVIAANLAAGDNRSAAGIRWNNDRAWVGVYATGPTSGGTHNAPRDFGATGRATFQVLQSPDYSFHVGVDAEGVVKPGGSGSVSLADKPELRVDPSSFIGVETIGNSTTSSIGSVTNPVTGAAVYGFELAGGIGSAYAQAEYFHYSVARQGLPDLNFNGGYVEASYTLTGESHKYSAGCGCYGGISPAHPFSLKTGGWGAFEVAARYSVVDLNDNFTAGSTVGNGFAGGKQTIYAFGINWYPNNNLRFMLDYLHGVIDRTQAGTGGTVPLGTSTGGTMDAVALRTQFAF
jgi:phosphate-selective porin OprO and OprP